MSAAASDDSAATFGVDTAMSNEEQGEKEGETK
jgi:hypothetical protein